MGTLDLGLHGRSLTRRLFAAVGMSVSMLVTLPTIPSPSTVRRVLRPVTLLLVAALLVSAVTATVALAAGRSQARLAPITGRLNQHGYTLIALSYDGNVVTTTKSGFRINPLSSPVTLQLVNSRGMYAGPLVVAGGGSRVYEGVRAGAKLGTIKVMNGYAVVTRRLAARFVDRTRWAHAVKGVPVANGRNYGLVRIAGKRTGSSDLGGDLAHSGVPNDISIDPQADGQIAALAPAPRATTKSKVAKAVVASNSCGVGIAFCPLQFGDHIWTDVTGTANVDAAGSTLADIDAEVSGNLILMLISNYGTPGAVTGARSFPSGTSRAELDCTGLSWCSPGGTGRFSADGNPAPQGPPFPDCCDPSGDGFGTIYGPGRPAVTYGGSGFALWPDAPTEHIGTGDTPILDLTVQGELVQQPLTLSYVFDTVPALDTWSDGAGDSGTITYPSATTASGTFANPLPVSANSSGDVVVTLTWWRPQRQGIAGAGEPAFMDIGHLAYSLTFYGESPYPAPPPAPSACDATAVTTSDRNVTPTPAQYQNANGSTPELLIDNADDQPANPANTLMATVDLTKCLAANGKSFPVGSNITFGITANPQQNYTAGMASQRLVIERRG